MGIFVTEDGFVKKTYDELKEEWETDFKAIFGEEVDLDSEGPVGQMVASFANRDVNIWDGAEEIYNSRDPNIAEGLSLDKIAAETGVLRQSETDTTIEAVFLYGDEGSVIPEDASIKQSLGDYTDVEFLLDTEVTISKDNARYIQVTVDDAGGIGEAFTITIDSTPYTFDTVTGSETGTEIALELLTLIEAGDFEGTVLQDGAVLDIQQTTTDFVIAITTNITEDLLASGGDFTSDTAGPIPVTAGTLNTIVTPESGWDSVYNPVAGVTGNEEETDADFRIRRAQTLTTGNATDDAIILAISNNVVGVTAVSIESNRTDVTVGVLPPHSFHVVVSGGDDDDIGQSIWDTQPSGIQSYGTTSVIVEDSEGNNQTVYFSRPTPTYIHVEVRRSFNDEETYPTDGDTQIKDNIVDWASENLTIGSDVIRQRLTIPIYDVPGIEDIEIELDNTENPGDAPTYEYKNIEVATDEYATFDTTRITVGDIP